MLLEPDGRLPITTVCVMPSGLTTVAVTFCATLGPLLVNVAVAVMVLPGVPCAVTLKLVLTSARALSAVTAVTVLLAVLASAVVVATPAVQACVVREPFGTL